MARPISLALLGVLAIGAASIAEPAAAMPVSGLQSVASDSGIAGDVEQARLGRRGFRGGFRRGGFARPGYGYGGYGYGYRHRSPIRRLIRRIL